MIPLRARLWIDWRVLTVFAPHILKLAFKNIAETRRKMLVYAMDSWERQCKL
jgi:hypothetical protein